MGINLVSPKVPHVQTSDTNIAGNSASTYDSFKAIFLLEFLQIPYHWAGIRSVPSMLVLSGMKRNMLIGSSSISVVNPNLVTSIYPCSGSFDPSGDTFCQ